MTIFICNGYSDARLAGKIARDLVLRGLEVWINPPEEGKNPETHYLDQVQGIMECDQFILVLSPTATTNVDIWRLTEVAANRGRKIAVAERQTTELLKKQKEILKDATMFDFVRARYEDALKELIAFLGGDPEAKIPESEVDPEEADKWLPGVWEITFENSRSGQLGKGNWLFDEERKAIGLIQTHLDDGTLMEMQIVGEWRFVDDRFTVQGESRVYVPVEDAMLPERMVYSVSLKVIELKRDEIKASGTIGDRVIFRRAPNDAAPIINPIFDKI
ncbi:MAG: hypothetical protein OHK0023_04510 [Anaerolineae bacterium]